MNIKIAFSGKMGSGKDTASDYLVEKYNGTKVSFASPIYDIMTYAQKICGFPIEKDRKFLQMVGADWAREKDVDVWINILLEKTSKESGNFFLSDLRFESEFDSLKKNNWVCVKIVKDHTEKSRAGTGSVNHISETSLDSVENKKWDYIITNNSNVKDFYQKLEMIISV
jgi:hypothetical protein